ncbi:hypothetical protein [Novosphingobium sp. P6W]|nr:hypothetical protein [Novosphingobium sp. P6W]
MLIPFPIIIKADIRPSAVYASLPDGAAFFQRRFGGFSGPLNYIYG